MDEPVTTMNTFNTLITFNNTLHLVNAQNGECGKRSSSFFCLWVYLRIELVVLTAEDSEDEVDVKIQSEC